MEWHNSWPQQHSLLGIPTPRMYLDPRRRVPGGGFSSSLEELEDEVRDVDDDDDDDDDDGDDDDDDDAGADSTGNHPQRQSAQ